MIRRIGSLKGAAAPGRGAACCASQIPLMRPSSIQEAGSFLDAGATSPVQRVSGRAPWPVLGYEQRHPQQDDHGTACQRRDHPTGKRMMAAPTAISRMAIPVRTALRPDRQAIKAATAETMVISNGTADSQVINEESPICFLPSGLRPDAMVAQAW